MDELPGGTDGSEERALLEAVRVEKPLDEVSADAVSAGAAQHTQELLAEHVPLTLLVDLLAPTRETSAEIMAAEGLPEQEWWADPEDDAPRP